MKLQLFVAAAAIGAGSVIVLAPNAGASPAPVPAAPNAAQQVAPQLLDTSLTFKNSTNTSYTVKDLNDSYRTYTVAPGDDVTLKGGKGADDDLNLSLKIGNSDSWYALMANNPWYRSPTINLFGDTHGYDVNEEHDHKTTDGVTFKGSRSADSSNYKNLTLTFTKAP